MTSDYNQRPAEGVVRVGQEAQEMRQDLQVATTSRGERAKTLWRLLEGTSHSERHYDAVNLDQINLDPHDPSEMC